MRIVTVQRRLLRLKKIVRRSRLQRMPIALSLLLAFTAQGAPDANLWIGPLQNSANMSLLNTTPVEPGQVLVFVSSSMPSTSLVQWFSQAQRLGASVILRGLVNNSLSATKAWMKPLIEQANNTGGVEINPMAFEAYGITQVPAVVVTTGSLPCSDEHSTTAPFDVVMGNTSLLEALKVVIERGDVGMVAQQKIAQMRATHE